MTTEKIGINSPDIPVIAASDIFKIRSESFIGKKRIRLWLLVLVIVGFSIYANALHAPFFFDDVLNITQNQAIRLNQMLAFDLRRRRNRPFLRPSQHDLGGILTHLDSHQHGVAFFDLAAQQGI